MHNKTNNISYDDMKYFLRKDVRELGKWPYNEENVTIAQLPATPTVNPDRPAMFCYTETNDDYMEFRRSAFWLVSGEVFMGISLSLLSISFIIMTTWSFFKCGFDSRLIVMYIICLFFAMFILPGAARVAFFSPHNLPVRLNRKTQKVYIASLLIRGNIFRRHPELVFQEMDWKYIEGWATHRKAGKGTSYYGLHLVENKTGNTESLQQACLYRTGAPWSTSGMAYQVNQIMSTWSYCQHYMNYLPVPDETKKPKQLILLPNNWLFKWPVAIDDESRKSIK